MTAARECDVTLMTGCVDARDIDLGDLPSGVIRCLACHGNGKRRQNYIEGKFTGRCDLCDATGFVYQHTARAVPPSVVNQIAVAAGVTVRPSSMYGNDWRRP